MIPFKRCPFCMKDHKITLDDAVQANLAHARRDAGEMARWSDYGLLASELDLIRHLADKHPSQTKRETTCEK